MILEVLWQKRESWISSGLISSCFQNSNISVLNFKQNLIYWKHRHLVGYFFKGLVDSIICELLRTKKSITSSWVTKDWWGIKYFVKSSCGVHKFCFRWVVQLHWGCFEAQSVRRELLPETAEDHPLSETCLICRIFLHQFYNLNYLNNSKISLESIQHYVQRT